MENADIMSYLEKEVCSSPGNTKITKRGHVRGEKEKKGGHPPPHQQKRKKKKGKWNIEGVKNNGTSNSS